MHIIGCDLHTRQQTLAILNTATGVLEERVLEHEGNNVEESIAHWKVQCVWASKLRVPCSGSSNCWSK